MNTSLAHYDACGSEPSTSDYSDLHRWTKWMRWDRWMTNTAVQSRTGIDSDGTVTRAVMLRGEVTRQRRCGHLVYRKPLPWNWETRAHAPHPTKDQGSHAYRSSHPNHCALLVRVPPRIQDPSTYIVRRTIGEARSR